MNTECPYCKSEMRKGAVYSDRYALKWIPEEQDKGGVLNLFAKGIKLTDLEKGYIEVYYCEKCKKMIFEISDMKNKKNV